MTDRNLLNKAIEIAVAAHKNQYDKSGEAYVGHLFRVMNMGRSIDEKICGVLHDLIEDTGWTTIQLEQHGFPPEIISAITCLTRTDSEDYFAFINRILENHLAIRVKINDLTDNLDIKRLNAITDNDVDRLNKYLKAYSILINAR